MSIRPKGIYTQKNGLFKFNKIYDLKEQSMEILEEQTDPILLANKNIKFACLQKMLECKKNNIYPDTLAYANCV